MHEQQQQLCNGSTKLNKNRTMRALVFAKKKEKGEYWKGKLRKNGVQIYTFFLSAQYSWCWWRFSANANKKSREEEINFNKKAIQYSLFQAACSMDSRDYPHLRCHNTLMSVYVKSLRSRRNVNHLVACCCCCCYRPILRDSFFTEKRK